MAGKSRELPTLQPVSAGRRRLSGAKVIQPKSLARLISLDCLCVVIDPVEGIECLLGFVTTVYVSVPSFELR